MSAKSRQRWLFYAYDRIRRRLLRTYSVNARWPRWSVLLGLLSAFEVCGMDDGWLAAL
ncbi:IS1 family transposase [Escherichia coli]